MPPTLSSGSNSDYNIPPRGGSIMKSKRGYPINRGHRKAIPLFENYMPIPESGCWIFMGKIQDTGYGMITKQVNKVKRYIGAHRLSWEMTYGPVPDGMLVCHKCDVRSCINPSHLFLGTYKDNSQDMKHKGRHKNGVSVGKKAGPRLSKEIILEIRTAIEQGEIGKEICKRFGISYTHYQNIKFRRDWKHI